MNEKCEQTLLYVNFFEIIGKKYDYDGGFGINRPRGPEVTVFAHRGLHEANQSARGIA